MKIYNILSFYTKVMSCVCFSFTTTSCETPDLTQEPVQHHQHYNLDQLLTKYGIHEAPDELRQLFSLVVANHQHAQGAEQKIDEDLALIAAAYQASRKSNQKLCNTDVMMTGTNSTVFWISFGIGFGAAILCAIGKVVSDIFAQQNALQQENIRLRQEHNEQLQRQQEITQGLIQGQGVLIRETQLSRENAQQLDQEVGRIQDELQRIHKIKQVKKHNNELKKISEKLQEDIDMENILLQLPQCPSHQDDK